MSDKLNWVERRKATEQRLAEFEATTWRDIRLALEEASASLAELYGRKVAVEKVNGHRLKITIDQNSGASKIRFIDVFWDEPSRRVSVEFDARRKPGLAFRISADVNGSFLEDSNNKVQVTPDELSRQTLESIFFDKPSLVETL